MTKKKERRWVIEGTVHVEFEVCIKATTPEAVQERLSEFTLLDFHAADRCEVEINPESIREVPEQ